MGILKNILEVLKRAIERVFRPLIETHTRPLREKIATLEEENIILRNENRGDHLTRLLNRRGFVEALEREVLKLPRPGSEHRHTILKAISIVMVDVDGFKEVNDLYGHLSGDKTLQMVAISLRHNACRSLDLTGRWGGDEFVLAILDATPQQFGARFPNGLPPVGLHLVQTGEEDGEGEYVQITLTAGVAKFEFAPQELGENLEAWVGRSIEETMVKADRALYAAKVGPKGRLHIYQ